jgi:hypothetical protein
MIISIHLWIQQCVFVYLIFDFRKQMNRNMTKVKMNQKGFFRTQNVKTICFNLMCLMVCVFYNVFNAWAAPTVVNTSVTYNLNNPFPNGFGADGIEVHSPAVLTIEGITLVMPANKSITLMVGAHMKLMNNAKIQSANTSSISADWQGILVQGSPNEEQYDEFPNPNITNDFNSFNGVLNPMQTSLIVDRSYIDNAILAIESKDGGIIRVINNSKLENCLEFIKIGQYKSTSRPEANACCVINSKLIWNSNYNITEFYGLDGRAMLRLNDVSGVLIGGTVFDNQFNKISCDRGIAIHARGSDFKVTEGGEVFCDGSDMGCTSICNVTIPGITRSKFNNFTNAITAWPSSLNAGANVWPKVSIRYSDFQNNLYGISIDGGAGVRIDNNTFRSSTQSLNTYFNVLENIGCSTSSNQAVVDIEIGVDARDFKIYSNTFEYDGYYVTSNSRAVNHIVLKPFNDFGGLIKANTFYNSSTHDCLGYEAVAILAFCRNRSLELLCNEFTNYGIDIELDPPAGAAIIKEVQMNPIEVSAGNKFYSSKKAGRYRIHNRPANQITYYCDLSDQYEDPYSFGDDRTTTGIKKLQVNLLKEDGSDCKLTCEDYLTSINKISINPSNLMLFPQPANTHLMIQTSGLSTQFQSYEVFDCMGQSIGKGIINTLEDFELNTTLYANGMYYITFYNGFNQTLSSKFIVQH